MDLRQTTLNQPRQISQPNHLSTSLTIFLLFPKTPLDSEPPHILQTSLSSDTTLLAAFATEYPPLLYPSPILFLLRFDCLIPHLLFVILPSESFILHAPYSYPQ